MIGKRIRIGVHQTTFETFLGQYITCAKGNNSNERATDIFTCGFVVALLGVGSVTWPLKQIHGHSQMECNVQFYSTSCRSQFFLYWQYLLKQFLSNWFLKFHLCTKYAVSALLCHKGTGKSKASIPRFSFHCYGTPICGEVLRNIVWVMRKCHEYIYTSKFRISFRSYETL